MRLPQDVAAFPLPGFNYSGLRSATLTAGAASTRVAIPTGSAGKFVVVRVSAPVWLLFGNSAVVAAADASSELWAGSELIHYVPTTATHIAAIRVGAADCALQLEMLSDNQLA
jgi:hypothetical protein